MRVVIVDALGLAQFLRLAEEGLVDGANRIGLAFQLAHAGQRLALVEAGLGQLVELVGNGLGVGRRALIAGAHAFAQAGNFGVDRLPHPGQLRTHGAHLRMVGAKGRGQFGLALQQLGVARAQKFDALGLGRFGNGACFNGGHRQIAGLVEIGLLLFFRDTGRRQLLADAGNLLVDQQTALLTRRRQAVFSLEILNCKLGLQHAFTQFAGLRLEAFASATVGFNAGIGDLAEIGLGNGVGDLGAFFRIGMLGRNGHDEGLTGALHLQAFDQCTKDGVLAHFGGGVVRKLGGLDQERVLLKRKLVDDVVEDITRLDDVDLALKARLFLRRGACDDEIAALCKALRIEKNVGGGAVCGNQRRQIQECQRHTGNHGQHDVVRPLLQYARQLKNVDFHAAVQYATRYPNRQKQPAWPQFCTILPAILQNMINDC